MSDLSYFHEQEYTLGVDSALAVSATQRADFVGLLHARRTLRLNPLGGRSCVAIGEIAGVGHVVARQYMRGGLLRLLVEALHLRIGKTRAEHEYQMLQKAREIGINVPDPIGYALRGGVLYEAWLFTREIADTKSMVELAFSEDERLPALIDALLAQVVLLIRSRILHVDLHPGNVLVDPAGKVYLLDFDKAVPFDGSLNDLRDRYLCRWRRAVIKHQLPDILAELVSHGLRVSFE